MTNRCETRAEMARAMDREITPTTGEQRSRLLADRDRTLTAHERHCPTCTPKETP